VAKAERFVQIKVTLNDTGSPIWRRLVLPTATALEDLHFIFLAAMGWEGADIFTLSMQRGENMAILLKSKTRWMRAA